MHPKIPLWPLLLTLTACAPIGGTSQTVPSNFLWATYQKAGPDQTDQQGGSYRYAYSEKKNETSGPFQKIGNAVRFQFNMGTGNNWSGAAIVAGVPGNTPTDLRGYLNGTLRITVNASNLERLMVRIDGDTFKADEDKYCWSAHQIQLTRGMREYQIPLQSTQWTPLGYCSADDRKETLGSALKTAKEIHLIAYAPEGIKGEIQLERIQFTQP